jgi:hypothetical protein
MVANKVQRGITFLVHKTSMVLSNKEPPRSVSMSISTYLYKVEHHVILSMLSHKWFFDKWIGWITSILLTCTSNTLLNGVPRKQFTITMELGKKVHCHLYYLYLLQICCKFVTKFDQRCSSERTDLTAPKNLTWTRLSHCIICI